MGNPCETACMHVIDGAGNPCETACMHVIDEDGVHVHSDGTVVVRAMKSYNKLQDKPSLNGVTIEGEHDSAYYHIDQTYVYTQGDASDLWIIQHNLNKFPSVTVVDSAKTVIVGDVRYIDENLLECKFTGAFSGTAYLN